jgi:energy-converting hydrogenase Eha subunit B
MYQHCRLASSGITCPGRRLMQRGGGIDGGIQTQDILSENDAAAGIQQAVSSGNAYQATEDGFRDAYGATL